LTLVTSATKKGWLENEVERFNTEKGGNIKIQYLETRDALQAIYNDKATPVLWSPSSPIWALQLSSVWQKKHGGDPLVNTSDPNTYRVYLKSPIVFVTTREKATFLRPLLTGNKAWTNIAALSAGKQRLPGASRPFIFAHADPIASNSGFLTLGLILNSYVQDTGGAQSAEYAAKSDGLLSYVQRVEKTMPLDGAVRGGSSALMKAFLDDPNRYDVITSYESSALEAAATHPNIVVLYPNPTVVSEQVVAVLSGPWTTPDQKATAANLLTYLGSNDSLKEGIATHFRPEQSSGDLTLGPELTRFQSQGFQQSYTAIELPSYEALNTLAYRWNTANANRWQR